MIENSANRTGMSLLQQSGQMSVSGYAQGSNQTVPLTQTITGIPNSATLSSGNLTGGYYSYPYTYYWPQSLQRNLEFEAAQLIALYKKQFGKQWKSYFRATVKIEVR